MTRGNFDLRSAQLHPDLRRSVRDGWVHNRFVIGPMPETPDAVAWYNQLYVQKTEQALLAAFDRDWRKYVFLHERPYRAPALAKLIDAGRIRLNGARAWKLVAAVWIDSENVQQFDGFWSITWRHYMAGAAMRPVDCAALRALPDPVPVWHGLERADRKTLGFSWTTDEKIGRWFARRFASLNGRAAYIARGEVAKSDVRAYLLARGEQEIIAFPEAVRNVQITRIGKAASK